MAFGGGNQEVMSEINVTPLCDIFVVLLIILMMAADSANQQGPAIDLPSRINTPPDSLEPEHDACNITVKDLGVVYVNGEASSLEDLPTKLQSVLSKIAKKEVMVRAAPDIPLDRVVKVMGIAYANGAKGIGLGTMLRTLSP